MQRPVVQGESKRDMRISTLDMSFKFITIKNMWRIIIQQDASDLGMTLGKQHKFFAL